MRLGLPRLAWNRRASADEAPVSPPQNTSLLSLKQPLKLLMFAEDWGGLPSSSQHLATALIAEANIEIIWVNSIGLRRPKPSDLRRLWQKLWMRSHRDKEACRVQSLAPTVVISPKLWPLPQWRWSRYFNGRVLAWQLHLQGVQRTTIDWVWCALPSAVTLLSLFPQARTIYYVGDDFSALAGVDHAQIAPLHQQLLTRCQLLFCASDTLLQQSYAALLARLPNTRIASKVFAQPPPYVTLAKILPCWSAVTPWPQAALLPHGVDLAAFSAPTPWPSELPTRLAKQPIIGFYGSLAEWIDFSLLHYLAQRFHDCCLVLIGHRGLCPQSLIDLPNVYWLPFVAHARLPALVQRFCVGLLPFVVNGQIAACDPLKLREYLAAGVPIVSRPFAALRQYSHGINCAMEPCAFGDAVARYLHQPPPATQLQTQVAQASWQARAQSILTYLQPRPHFCENANTASPWQLTEPANRAKYDGQN
ncbi:MAG: glycosyltransferase [Ferrimonas sp.]